MPQAAPRPCLQRGCPELTRDGWCDEHRKARIKRYDAERGSAAKRNYGHRWRKVRLAYLRRHPLCVWCDADGRLTASTVVDHIVPHRGDKRLFWNRKNWQALWKPCHDRKGAIQDGRWTPRGRR